MIHKFVLGRCIQCNLPVEELESTGWECLGHSNRGGDTHAPNQSAKTNPVQRLTDQSTRHLPLTSVAPAQSPTETTDVFAILSFTTGILGFWILPIVFVPICYVTSIISYYRLKENPRLKGKGLRLTGAILGALSMLYLFYQLGIIG